MGKDILVLKTGALGDVLRTTSILPGLIERYPGAQVTWVAAPGAVDLVRNHPLVTEVEPLATSSREDRERLTRKLRARAWGRVLSFDDEVEMCAMASEIAPPTALPGVLSGAHLDASGARTYTADVGPWFDMGLLSRFGKEDADRRKRANRKSHPEIFAEMLGIRMGETELPLPDESLRFAKGFFARHGLRRLGPVVGLNTGAGGRWEGKKLPVERACALAREIHARRGGAVEFLVLGGPDERDRNRSIVEGAGADIRIVDAGVDNALLDFSAIVGGLDLLVSSDSLAMHIGIARRVPIVAFFAPTSADEIHMYGRGECVRSLAQDYCSYRRDADTSTLTVERLLAAALRWLAPR